MIDLLKMLLHVLMCASVIPAVVIPFYSLKLWASAYSEYTLAQAFVEVTKLFWISTCDTFKKRRS